MHYQSEHQIPCVPEWAQQYLIASPCLKQPVPERWVVVLLIANAGAVQPPYSLLQLTLPTYLLSTVYCLLSTVYCILYCIQQLSTVYSTVYQSYSLQSVDNVTTCTLNCICICLAWPGHAAVYCLQTTIS